MKQSNYGLFALLFFFSTGPETVSAQAKKPTAMVVPSSAYMTRKNFFTEIPINGKPERVFDYKRMFEEDSDVRTVIANINGYMVNEGFPLKDLEEVLKGIATSEVEEEVVKGKNNDELQETMLDKVQKTAKADILIDIDFQIKQNGPERYITLTFKGNDGYTNKNVAVSTLVGKPSMSASTDVLLVQNNYACMSKLVVDIQKHFTDIQANGREVKLQFRVSESSDVNLETEFDGMELNRLIEGWLEEECVQSRFGTTVSTETKMVVEQVRIPLMDKTDKAMDTKKFMYMFLDKLKKPPFNLNCRVTTRGLGEAWLIISGAKK